MPVPEVTGALTVEPGGRLLVVCGICAAAPGALDMAGADGGGIADPFWQAAKPMNASETGATKAKRISGPLRG